MNFNKIALVTGLAVSGIALGGTFLPANASFTMNYSGEIYIINGQSPLLPTGIEIGTPVTGTYTVDDSLGALYTISGLPQFPITNYSFSFPSFGQTITAPLGTQYFPGGSPTIQAVFGAAGVKPGNDYIAGAYTSFNPTAAANVVLPTTITTFPNLPGLYFTDFSTNAGFAAHLTSLTGINQSNPFLPTSAAANRWIFRNVPNLLWYDPPFSSRFTYSITSPGSLFTKILGFPTGFSSPFTVEVQGSSLGTFNPGDTFIFPGSGVSEFSINGINPEVDVQNPTAFPLQLEFNTPTASFEIITNQSTTQVPEPTSALSLLALGTLGAGVTLKQKLKTSKSADKGLGKIS